MAAYVYPLVESMEMKSLYNVGGEGFNIRALMGRCSYQTCLWIWPLAGGEMEVNAWSLLVSFEGPLSRVLARKCGHSLNPCS